MTFVIPGPLSETTPFCDLHVWQWAQTVPRADVSIGKYLDSLGFVVGTDRLTESEYDVLSHACEHFHRVAPHAASMKFGDAFKPDESGFYVRGKPGRYALAPVLRDALEGAGWIYDIQPETTYFELMPDGRLIAKYQQIIGSRVLCEILEG